MFRVTHKEEIFFDQFVATAELTCKAAEKLDELINNYSLDILEQKICEIEDIEHDCDQSIHDIMQQLNKSFITPIDREDINQIAKEIDNITDDIEATAQRFKMFNVKEMTEDAKILSKLIVVSTVELKNVLLEMKNMKTSKTLIKKIIEVNRLENEGDDAFRVAVTNIFADGMDAVDVFKWKEIYDYLENTLDACEDVANIVEGVVMKNV